MHFSSFDLDESDHTNLEPVDIYKRKAKESLRYLCSDENSYSPRDDYDELLKLVYFTLNGKLLVTSRFGFQELNIALGACLHQFMHSNGVFCAVNLI